MDNDDDEEGAWDTDVTHYSLEELAEALGVSPSASRTELTLAADSKVRALGGREPELAAFFEQAKVRMLSLLSMDNGTRTIVRLLNLDSAYRPAPGVDNQDSDSYTCTLSERLTGVLSITLLSLEVPQTWYTFSQAKGTSAFLAQVVYAKVVPGDNPGSTETVSDVYTTALTIPDGNYSNKALVALVQAALNAFVPTIPDYSEGKHGAGPWFALAQDPRDGKVRLTLKAGFKETVKLVWFDPSRTRAELLNARSNSNLGWELGFRTDYTALQPSDVDATADVTVAAPSLVSGIGTKYILMRLKDHTSGRLTNGALTLGAPNLHVELPPYSRARRGAVEREVGAGLNLPQASAEQQLTAKQVYTINAISNRVSVQSGRAQQVTTDLFAKIPIKRQTDWSNYVGTSVEGVVSIAVNEDGPAKLAVELGGTLQRNKRAYAGPINLSTITVSLYDDRGNLLGLNGHDWSCTLELETLPPA